MSSFQFKQFKIIQEQSAMKVGTDGVLLGAWADISSANTILDIGSGTGLISLMCVQRNEFVETTAIEIDSRATLESKYNFENSAWSNRLTVLNQNIISFTIKNKFNYIISNPPFFNNSFKANTKERNQARQMDNLSFEKLISCTASLLSKNGKSGFIIPFQEENDFVKMAKANKLFLNRRTRVKGNINTETKRSLLEFSFKESKLNDSEIALEISRHSYTSEYIKLVKAFYIKM